MSWDPESPFDPNLTQRSRVSKGYSGILLEFGGSYTMMMMKIVYSALLK